MALRRPYITSEQLYIPAPVGGWNPDANPWELADDQAAQLDNFFVQPNKLVMRGPLIRIADFTGLTGAMQPSGVIMGQTAANYAPGSVWILVGRKTMNLDPVDTPWAHLGAAGTPSTAITQAAYTDTSGQNVTNITLTADNVPGPRWINYDGLIYYISIDSSAGVVHDTNSNYFIKPTNLCTLSAILASPGTPTPTVQTLAPHGAYDITVYQNRIWLLGGVDTPGGGTVHNPNTLFYTIPGASGIGTASADWRDPVQGTTNIITINRDTSDTAVGFGRYKNQLIIFFRKSIYRLVGATPSAYTIQKVSGDIGCYDQRTIVETDRGIYFLSARGLMLTDGVQVVNVSGPVLRTLQTAIQTVRRSYNGWATMVVMPDGSLFMSMGVMSSGLLTPAFSAYYDPSTGAWSRITSALWSTDLNELGANLYPGWVVSDKAASNVITVGNKYLTGVEVPSANVSILQGNLVFGGGAYDYPFVTGSADKTAIPARWRTHLVGLQATSSVRRIASASRFFLDYVFAANPAFGGGWTVKPIDLSGNLLGSTLLTPVNLGASTTNGWITQVAGIVTPYIQRAYANLTGEIADLSFDITYTDATLRTSGFSRPVLEIYGVGLQFLPGAQEPLP